MAFRCLRYYRYCDCSCRVCVRVLKDSIGQPAPARGLRDGGHGRPSAGNFDNDPGAAWADGSLYRRADLARVVGTAGAINPTTKRLLTELEVPNKSGELFPGAYVQVALKIAGNSGDLTIPAGTLLFAAGKPAVGVVRPDGRVEVRKITISRDLGSILEISKGLSESDRRMRSATPEPHLTTK
jgi:hypothetical protein